MKRVEVIVQNEVSREVIFAIRKIGADAVTFMESLGQGEGQRPEISGKQADFNSTTVIISIVKDSQLDSVVSAIMDVAHTGQKKDGKIFITNVEETYDISTKQKLAEFN